MTNLDALKRDRWQRPLITPPAGTEPVPYIRASTIAGALDDKTGIHKWASRNMARGLVARPDLLALVGANIDDDKETSRILEDAANVGGSGVAANYGTAIHKFTETIDNGGTPFGVPADRAHDLDAYTKAMQSWEVVAAERFVVCDELRVAGTFDKLIRGRTWTTMQDPQVADVKTGKDAEHPLKVCIQLAIYAHGYYYDPATAQRTDTEADHDIGKLIVVRDNTCAIYNVDLITGWDAAKTAVAAHRYRALKPADLITKIDEVQIEPAPIETPFGALQHLTTIEGVRDAYRTLVADGYGPKETEAACRTRIAELTAV